MLGQRRRRWANIETTLGQVLVFAGWQCEGSGLKTWFPVKYMNLCVVATVEQLPWLQLV